MQGLVTTVIAIAAFALQIAAAQAQDKITFASYGGKYQQNVVKALLAPAGEKLGVKVLDETHKHLSSVRVQVQSGSPSWDIVQLGSDECAVGEEKGLFEELDRSIIDFTGIPADARGKAWVGANYYSIVLAWQKGKYGDKAPKNWQDFWNVEAFPGTRSLPAFASGTLEAALMADGVPPDRLYPLDVERAIEAVKKIAPHIAVWWSSGAQSAQLLKDREIDMMMIWGSRVAAAIEDGADVAFTYDEGILGVGCFAIPKGAPNAGLAQKMIAEMVKPEIQANIPVVLGYYGPVNEKAFEVPDLPEDIINTSNSSPANMKKQVVMSVDWWQENQNKLRVDERYKEVIIAP